MYHMVYTHIHTYTHTHTHTHTHMQFVPGKNVNEDQIPLGPASMINETSTGTMATPSVVRYITCHEHVISSLILLDFVVIAAYFFGVYLFSRGETEYLFGLASHVSGVVGVAMHAL